MHDVQYGGSTLTISLGEGLTLRSMEVTISILILDVKFHSLVKINNKHTIERHTDMCIVFMNVIEVSMNLMI